jgi:hypothetical protein
MSRTQTHVQARCCLHGSNNRNTLQMPSPSPRRSQTCPAPLPQATLAVPTLQKSVAGRGSEPAMRSTGAHRLKWPSCLRLHSSFSLSPRVSPDLTSIPEVIRSIRQHGVRTLLQLRPEQWRPSPSPRGTSHCMARKGPCLPKANIPV